MPTLAQCWIIVIMPEVNLPSLVKHCFKVDKLTVGKMTLGQRWANCQNDGEPTLARSLYNVGQHKCVIWVLLISQQNLLSILCRIVVTFKVLDNSKGSVWGTQANSRTRRTYTVLTQDRSSRFVIVRIQPSRDLEGRE
jgi:hypothetical protein